MKTLRDLWIIARKDLLEFVRDRLRLVTFFIMPIFMMIMTGFIFPNQNSLKNVPIGIANEDNGAVSLQLVDTIGNFKLSANSSSAFKVLTYSDKEAIVNAIKDQAISGGLDIPSGFSQKIALTPLLAVARVIL